MFLWVILTELHSGLVSEMKAAVDIMQETYQAHGRGLAPRPLRGLVFATDSPIPEDYHQLLGILPFN